tara:strand:+ start:2109 stop:2282 length:174 start_codon:yes stop_codon:yes gene_type:complete
MELDMYNDPKRKCCCCSRGADLKERSKYYCCEHYAIHILGKTMEQIEKELNKNDMDI